MENKDIIIYQGKDGKDVEVRVESETVWLTQAQIASVFDVNVPAINKHIKNIYNDGELAENATVSKMETVVKRGFRGTVSEPVDIYNLDMIIAVGYRVNSKRATAFRIWATDVLKRYMIQGFAVNRQKLEAQQKKLADLTKLIDLIKDGGVQSQIENVAQAREIIGVLADFATGFEVLDNYDNERLDKRGRAAGPLVTVSAEEFLDVIKRRAGDFESPLFGVPLGDGFAGSVGQIYQSFDGRDLYPTLEEKAANLLYLVTKNHSFADGNKRIAATCFIYFLLKNNMLWNAQGEKSVDDFALAALTLLIAESKPAEKDTMCRLVITILNKR
jgi:prophage maintenance system killer protein